MRDVGFSQKSGLRKNGELMVSGRVLDLDLDWSYLIFCRYLRKKAEEKRRSTSKVWKRSELLWLLSSLLGLNSTFAGLKVSTKITSIFEDVSRPPKALTGKLLVNFLIWIPSVDLGYAGRFRINWANSKCFWKLKCPCKLPRFVGRFQRKQRSKYSHQCFLPASTVAFGCTEYWSKISRPNGNRFWVRSVLYQIKIGSGIFYYHKSKKLSTLSCGWLLSLLRGTGSDLQFLSQ